MRLRRFKDIRVANAVKIAYSRFLIHFRRIFRMATGFFTHNRCLSEDEGNSSLDRPERIEQIQTLMQASALARRVRFFESSVVSESDLLLVHTPEYLKKLKDLAQKNAPLTEETLVTDELLVGAMQSAGAAVSAVRSVLDGSLKNAFVCVRPPGHHAGRNFGGGFCLINSAACAVRTALCRYRCARVALIDVDAHRADGSEDIFSGDPSVLLFDSYQASAYPYGLAPCTAPNVFNMPLEDGALGRDVVARMEKDWLPRLYDFAPDLLVLSFGFDTHTEDTQTLLKFSEFEYAYLTRLLMRVAHDVCSDRLVSILEGGYNKKALARSVLSHVGTLVQ